jgi:Kef-type K+ transport system membrane component KefB/nucleotide-binding universal stress UspA family protein
METILQLFSRDTIIIFAILLLIILFVPLLLERLRIPGLIGFVGSGVILGPFGWNLLQAESPIVSLLSDIGLDYLIFVAGLEFNLHLFRECKIRSLLFSCFTCSIPLILGTFLGLLCGFSGNAAILIGCLISSSTPIAYPILVRLGLIANESINVAMGATIFSNLGTLIILAAITTFPHSSIFNINKLVILTSILVIYSLVILLGFNRVGKEFFLRYGDDESNKFLFVISAIFITSIIAQFLHLGKILSFFLVGLLVNQTAGESAFKEKFLYIGNVFFIPIFLINLGLFIDLHIYGSNYPTYNFFWLSLLLFLTLITSKFLAALLAKVIYQYNWQETITIWLLSIPLLHITLAVSLAGYQWELWPSYVFNSAIFLVLFTSSITPWLSGWFAQRSIEPTFLSLDQARLTDVLSAYPEAKNNYAKNVIVHIHKSATYQYLIELSALLTHQTNGKIVPLAIAHATAQMDAPHLENTCQSSNLLLEKATTHSQSLGAKADPLLRIDYALAPGITRAAREQKASLIIINWNKPTDLRGGLFGTVVNSVLWSAHCPVAAAHLVESPKRIQRMLLPIENIITPSLQPLHFAQTLADTNQAQLTVLNVSTRQINPTEMAARRDRLARLISPAPNPPEIQIIIHENFTQAILQAARLYDLVILPFTRNRLYLGSFAFYETTIQIASQLTCSMIILAEPQNNHKIIRQSFSRGLSINPDFNSYQNT